MKNFHEISEFISGLRREMKPLQDELENIPEKLATAKRDADAGAIVGLKNRTRAIHGELLTLAASMRGRLRDEVTVFQAERDVAIEGAETAVIEQTAALDRLKQRHAEELQTATNAADAAIRAQADLFGEITSIKNAFGGAAVELDSIISLSADAA